MSAHFYRLIPVESPWGDYGRILAHGISTRLERQKGSIQLERTGPTIAPITFPGSGDVVVTQALQTALAQSGMTGFSFQPVIKRRIVELDWEEWDVAGVEPEELPEDGEPENYILRRPHETSAADELGILAELVVADGIEVVREGGHVRVLPDTWNGNDFFRARTTRLVCVNANARRWLEQHVGDYVEFGELTP